MRLHKLLIYIIFTLFILFLVIPVFLPDAIQLSHSKKMRATDKQVFRLVNNFENWKRWSPFMLDDPSVEARITGPAMGVGSSLVYNSHTAGQGSITITENIPYKSIRMTLDMKDGGLAVDHWQFEQEGDSVTVTWTLSLSNLKYPFHRYFGFFSRSLMTPFQQQGLERLAEVAASIEPPLPVDTAYVEGTKALIAKPNNADWDFNQAVATASELVRNHMKRLGFSNPGEPLMVFESWKSLPPEHASVGFVVYEETRESGEVRYIEIPGGKTISTALVGTYEKRKEAYDELLLSMQEFGFSADSSRPVIEFYAPSYFDTTDKSPKVLRIFLYVKQIKSVD